MINESKLSTVLSEFARTLITDFPIQGILDHLVERVVEVLPVTSAGVTLISEGMAPRFIAASDDNALRFEKLQTDLGQGPCLLAFDSGIAVEIPDLVTETRFPQFTAAALDGGLSAVFTFPMRHGDGRLGALDVYRDSPGGLDAHDLEAAQTLADVAAAYLLNAEAREEARATSDRFLHSALHDPLTGLPNRLLLQERLEHLAQRSKRSHTNAAILFADLDHFKLVNDTYGHQIGDELLRAVANRLSGVIRTSDTLARFAGDEFVFLCEDVRSAADVDVIAHRIDAAFDRPFALAGTNLLLEVSASVGMAFAGPGEDISEELVVRADRAMYLVKNARTAIDLHEILDLRDTLDAPEPTQVDDCGPLERELRLALVNDELDVAYQPIVDSKDGSIVGVEALLRWTHPDRGAVSPIAIVRVAEQSDLINDIGAWVLERSCRDHGRWAHDHPGTPLDLAVNVSARQLISPTFATTFARVLASTGMDPTELVLEMTENILIEDTELAMVVLADLNRQGIRLSLDDFGTGYSSLSYLRRLPIHNVKIDRSFISDLGRSPESRAIVAGITDLAHVLGLTVTAEGVETESERDEVRAAGCEHSQGFYYARPMTATAVGELLGGLGRGDLPLPAGRPI